MKKSEKNSEEKNLSMRSLLRDVYIENKLKENRNSPKEDRLTDDQIRVIAKDEFTDSDIYRNHYYKLTKILQAFDKMINDSSTKADIYIKKLSEISALPVFAHTAVAKIAEEIKGTLNPVIPLDLQKKYFSTPNI